jgi:hypothetical protein
MNSTELPGTWRLNKKWSLIIASQFDIFNFKKIHHPALGLGYTALPRLSRDNDLNGFHSNNSS